MAQPVTAILSQQQALSQKARLFTGDVNEAGLLVGQVFCHAFSRFYGDASADEISRSMRGDMDRLIEQLRKRRV